MKFIGQRKNVRATKVTSHAFKRRKYEILWLIVGVIDLVDFIDNYKVVPLYLHALECLLDVT